MTSASSPPHIRAEGTVPRMMWTVALALLPAVISSFVFFGFQALRVIAVALASALIGEIGTQKIFGRRLRVYDGSTVAAAFLISLFLLPHTPSWMVGLSSLFAIIFGKEIFGGLGQNPFNPALVGISFLFISFPSTRSLMVGSSLGPTEVTFYALAVFLGGVILIFTKLIYWEVPFLYLGSLLIFSFALAQNGEEILLSGGSILLAAFFLVTDSVTTPLTRLGSRWFALGSGFLCAVVGEWRSFPEGAVYGILLMNGLSPWLDRWFRPRSG